MNLIAYSLLRWLRSLPLHNSPMRPFLLFAELAEIRCAWFGPAGLLMGPVAISPSAQRGPTLVAGYVGLTTTMTKALDHFSITPTMNPTSAQMDPYIQRTK